MLEFYAATTSMVNSKKAITECLKKALAGQPNLYCDLIIIHTNMGHNFTDLISEAKKLSNGAAIVGCSATGVIGMDGPDESPRALGIMAIKGPRNEFAVAGIETMVNKDPYTACAHLAEDLKNQNPDINLINFMPSWQDVFPTDRTIEGFESVFGKDVPVFGGCAADAMLPTTSFQFLKDQVFERGAVAIGFADPTLEYHLGVSHGHMAFGSPIEVTRCEGNRIYELNGQPAWKFICEKLNLSESTLYVETGELHALALELPKKIHEEFGNSHLVYASMIINKDGSLIYPLQIKVGTKLFWSRRDDKKIFMSAEYLGKRLHDKLAGRKPVAVFHVECGSRGSNYFNQAEREKLIRCVQVPLTVDQNVPWLGWYANGEFGPVGGKNRYFHFSVVLCTLIRINEQ
jgi:hypothetical protein